MRHWQPLHHARLRDFLAGLAAALRGEAPALAPVPLALPVAPDAPAPLAPLPPPVVAELAPPPASSAPVSEIPIPEPVFAPVPPAPPPVAPPPAPAVPEFVAPPPLPAPVAPPSTARAFFASLGWTTGRPVPASDLRALPPDLGAFALKTPTPPPAPPSPATPAPSPASASPATSAAFFRALPWSGASALGEVITSFRVTAARGDSALDPRTAPLPSDNPLLTGMLSAARTSDRLATKPAPAKARAFFASLPW